MKKRETLKEMVQRIIKEEINNPIQKYKNFIKTQGHLVSTSSGIVEDWIDKEGKNLSLKDVEIVAKHLFGNNDAAAYQQVIRYAKQNGLK